MGSPANSASTSRALARYVSMATIAAAFAVVALFNQALTDVARAAFGFYGAMLFGGLFQTPGILAYALIGRRGTAFITQNVFGLMQLAMGNPAGFVVLWFTFAEALGQEAFLLTTPKRAYDRPWVWGGAGVASWLAAQVPNYFLFGLGEMPLWSWLLPIIVVGIPVSILTPIVIILAVRRTLPLPLAERLNRE